MFIVRYTKILAGKRRKCWKELNFVLVPGGPSTEYQKLHSIHNYKEKTKDVIRAKLPGNLGTNKPRLHAVKATATLHMLMENNVDEMPLKMKTLQSGEKWSPYVYHHRFGRMKP